MALTQPKLFLITGIMASGKSTVAQALAERFDRSAHLRGDTFRRSIVSGRVEMSPDPSADALEQLRLRHELAVECADRYVESGFVTVLQDTILGPMLADVVDMFRAPEVNVIVLAPSPAEVARRESQRAKVGYTTFTPQELDVVLRDQTPRIGTWLDSSDLTVDATVQQILDHHAD